MSTNANECKQQSDLDHAKQQFNMYIGANTVSETTEYILDEKDDKTLEQKEVRTNYAALKVLDEILVNALDQKLKCEQKDKQSEFNVYIEQKGDVISYMNINSYINIQEKKSTLDGRVLYLPQFLFGEFKTSTNFTKVARDTGGAFGYGAKLTNAFSKFFRVEIHHPGVGLYMQEWTDRMTKVSEPVITPENTSSALAKYPAYVRITVLLDWDTFHITTNDEKAILFNMARVRAIQGAASIGPKHKVYWNNELIAINTPKALQTLYAPSLIETVQVELKNNVGTWNVIAGVRDDGDYKFKHFLLTNGNYSKNGGSQIEHIKGQIVEFVRPRILDMIKKTEKKRVLESQITRYLYLQIISKVLDAQYSGQKKEEITLDAASMSGMVMDSNILLKLWESIMPLVSRDFAEEKTPTKQKKIKNAKKYQQSERSGLSCSLFIVEGDSAYGVVSAGIKTGYCGLSNTIYGIYSIQGVPINPRPFTRRLEEGKFEVNKKVFANERLMTLFGILGLEIGKKADFSKLAYGHVIIVTDEDEDGRGNIRSSLVSTFQLYWPDLINAGFLQFMRTPLIRAIPSNSNDYTEEFYSEREYNEWKTKTANSSSYSMHYFKGLASHRPSEIKQMFKNFNKMLITYKTDQFSDATCEIYFGRLPGPRVQMLAYPVMGTEDDYFEDGKLSISKHCNTETKSFMFYNLHRHIPKIDGMTNAQRIIVAGLFKHARGKEIKVDSLAAWIKTKLEYHHGLASLEESLIGLAQSFVGAKEIPFARAFGSFGDRDIPVAGSPRYISTGGNMRVLDLLFPEIDSYMLKHEFREGKRCEPEHFMPIIPPMFNTHRSPAKGAACKIIARDIEEIFERTKLSIKAGAPIRMATEFKICERGLRHKVVYNESGNPVSLGTYILDPENETLTITELPMFITCLDFIDGSGKSVKKEAAKKKGKGKGKGKASKTTKVEDNTTRNKTSGIRKLDWVKKVMNNTKEDKVNIVITMNEKQPFGDKKVVGPIEDWKNDPIIQVLHLSTPLKPNLKFLVDGAVKQYDSYIKLFEAWWPMRKTLYEERINRSIILLKIRNTLIENQLRYIAESNTMKMNISGIQQIDLLIEKKYQPIVTKVLKASYVPTQDLIKVAFPAPNRNDATPFDYIIHMRQNDLSNEHATKLTNELKENLVKIAELSQSGYAMQTWLNEVEELEKIVKMGQESDWTCWDKKVKFR